MVDEVELADLLQQVACFAPGQAFHRPPASSSASSTPAPAIDPARLRGALGRSLVCVAAYTSEQHLPPHQHLSSHGLLPLPPLEEEQPQQQQPWPALPPFARQQRRVLVGFARAVGDASLVATVHDVAVLPELQRLGLGRQLLARLVKQASPLGCPANLPCMRCMQRQPVAPQCRIPPSHRPLPLPG